MIALRRAESRGRWLLAGAFIVLPHLGAQTRLMDIGSSVHLVNADLATLESQMIRKDLPCEVKPTDPVLGFDLRFHTGYDVTVPLKELAGSENMLTMIFRVTPEQRKDEPVYFIQHVRVPAIEENAGGEAALNGMFDLGEGKYHVDWMMRDRSERVCSHYWDSKAELSAREKEIQMEIASGAVENSEFNQFVEDPPVHRAGGRLLNVKVLVNFAPQNQESSAMRPIDTLALVTMMRRITREPRFGRFSVVAFNIQQQSVIYRQESADRISFPALGEALRSVKPGLVHLSLLANEHGEVEFLVDLIKNEMSSPDRPDAIIFAGPKALLDDGVPKEELRPVAESVDFPVFYLNYNTIPQVIPWRDSIGNAIRVFGGTEYTISRPRDLWFAVSEMVSHIVELNQGKDNEVPASQ
jgi:hypothetical protein